MQDLYHQPYELQGIVQVARLPMPYTLNPTHGPLSSSFLGLPCRILNVPHKKELLRGLWVSPILKTSTGLVPGNFLSVADILFRQESAPCNPQHPKH